MSQGVDNQSIGWSVTYFLRGVRQFGKIKVSRIFRTGKTKKTQEINKNLRRIAIEAGVEPEALGQGNDDLTLCDVDHVLRRGPILALVAGKNSPRSDDDLDLINFEKFHFLPE